MEDCPFCPPRLDPSEIKLENDECLFLATPTKVLTGSGMIVPRRHRVTAFDLTPTEMAATHALLLEVKREIDQELSPAGYNLGWNCGATAGQEVFHAHLHVIPRFADEPYAGRGIRYWFKQEANRRPPSL